VVTAKLEAVDLKDVKEALLLDDGEQFYLALNKAVEPTKVNGGILYTNFSNGTRCTNVNGMFFAFDRKGRMNWYANVTNQMVVLEQFKNIPVVLFTTRYNWMQNGGWQRWVVDTRSIDKKTGKLLYAPKQPKDFNGQQWYALNVNVKKGTIDLIGGSDAIQHYLDDGRQEKREGGVRGDERKPDQKFNVPPQPRPLPIRRLPIQRQFGVPVRDRSK
jgi:hypothetical protein